MRGSRLWTLFFLASLLLFHPAHAGGRGGDGGMTLSSSPPGERHHHESAHRPKPARSYWVSGAAGGDTRAYLIRPDGSRENPSITVKKGARKISFETPMGDGPSHGPLSLYVVNRKVENGILLENVAKLTPIHHSCGWGHDHKYDEARLSPKIHNEVPLEISCGGIWNGNFHYSAASGETIECSIYSYGKPLSGARVKAKTHTGWAKELFSDDAGKVRFQLMRDYYTEKWSDFDHRHVSGIMMTAEYQREESGELSGVSYGMVKTVSTYPFGYATDRSEYTSYSSGLAIGTAFLVLPALIVYTYRERRKRPFREPFLDEKN